MYTKWLIGLVMGLGLIMSATIGNADSRVYIGEEQGRLMAGVEVTTVWAGVTMINDIRSQELSSNSIGFTPSFVTYSIELGTNLGNNSYLALIHSCKHSIDNSGGKPLNLTGIKLQSLF